MVVHTEYETRIINDGGWGFVISEGETGLIELSYMEYDKEGNRVFPGEKVSIDRSMIESVARALTDFAERIKDEV